MEYRIIRRAIEGGEVARETVWSGDDKPNTDHINHVRQSVKRLTEVSARSPFRQDVNDMLIVQERRTPALLGWKTVGLVNIFNDLE